MTKRRSSYYDNYWPRYESSRPIRVQGGIVARSQRGRFVEHWWANRWIEALTGFMDSGRLSRGRSYARRGQVLEIDIKPGKVSARVQGSRRAPYRVQIVLEPLSNAQWDQVLDALAEQALFAAQLLNGEMPPEIEEVFRAVRVPLFPERQGDLETECSCPDWVNPCKHIAAVSYLLGERFDGDPFLLFELRGRSQKEIAAALRQRRARGIEIREAPEAYQLGAIEPAEVANLQECLDSYWTLDTETQDMAFQIAPPPIEMALLKRLGLPGYLEGRTFWPQMSRVYAGVAARALEKAFAEAGEGEQEAARREQLVVLSMLQEGTITTEEAERLIEALEN
jgi:uncharacterized Zn finger protein